VASPLRRRRGNFETVLVCWEKRFKGKRKKSGGQLKKENLRSEDEEWDILETPSPRIGQEFQELVLVELSENRVKDLRRKRRSTGEGHQKKQGEVLREKKLMIFERALIKEKEEGEKRYKTRKKKGREQRIRLFGKDPKGKAV